jgi:ribonuclease P protein component
MDGVAAGKVESKAGSKSEPAIGAKRSEGFPRTRRVRKRVDYLAIQGGGRRVSGDHYMLFARRPEGERAEAGARVGITVSRKVGGAVVRNKVKRWLRESCRRMQADLPAGLDLVIVARPSAARAGYGPTASELANLARRCRAIK